MKSAVKKQYDLFENVAAYVTAQNIRMVSDDEILEMARQISINRLANMEVSLTSPNKVANYLKTLIGTEEREVFCVLYLDSQHKVIATETLFFGTLDGASVYPREVVKAALKHNAGAAIISHNHPSGSCEPSQADQNITRRLKDALSLVDIRLLDHLVVSPSSHVSFAERGLI